MNTRLGPDSNDCMKIILYIYFIKCAFSAKLVINQGSFVENDVFTHTLSHTDTVTDIHT